VGLARAVALAGCGTDTPTAPADIAKPVSAPSPQGPAVTVVALPAEPVEGAQAPDFTVKGLDGKPVRLSDFRGKRVVLNFWATWCSPCRIEIPELQAAYARYGKDGLVVLAIDYAESAERVKQFVQDNGLTFPIGIDDTGYVLMAYQVRGIPTSFFIDRNGLIVQKHLSVLTQAVIERTLARMP